MSTNEEIVPIEEKERRVLFCPNCKERIPLVKLMKSKTSPQDIDIFVKCVCQKNNVNNTSSSNINTLSSLHSRTESTPGRYKEKLSLEVYLDKINLKAQKHICNTCSKEAFMYCSECGEYLCKDCLNSHNKLRINHSNSLSEIRIVSGCIIHSLPITIYCKTCDSAICTSCLEEMHKKHKTINNEFFVARIIKRKLYENFHSKVDEFKIISKIYSQVHTFLVERNDEMPYLHDSKITNRDITQVITFNYFEELFYHYKKNNDLLIELINCLFTTSEMIKNQIISVANLANIMILNNEINSEELEEINNIEEINDYNIKDFILFLVKCFHTNLIDIERYPVFDYYRINEISTKGQKIIMIRATNDKGHFILLTDDNTVYIIDPHEVDTTEELKLCDITNNSSKDKSLSLTYMAILMNGFCLFGCDDGTIFIHDLTKNNSICSFETNETKSRITLAAEYQSNKIAICSSDNIIRIYDLEKGLLLNRLYGQIGTSSIISIEKDVIASASYLDTNIMLWRCDKGGCLNRIKTSCFNNSLCIIKKDEMIIACGIHTINIFDWNFEFIRKIDFEVEIGGAILLEDSSRVCVWERGKTAAIFDNSMNCLFKIRGVQNEMIFCDYSPITKEFISNGNFDEDIIIWYFE